MAIQNPFVESRTVKYALDLLNSASKKVKSLTLHWVKAHIGIPGNELADGAAKAGAEVSDLKINLPLPQTYFNMVLDDITRKAWDNRWKGLNKARQTKQFYGSPDKNKARYVMKLSRLEMTRFVNVITGHNQLNYHLSLQLGDVFSECCFCGQERETFFPFSHGMPETFYIQT